MKELFISSFTNGLAKNSATASVISSDNSSTILGESHSVFVCFVHN